ncbi:MAG: hypothetical protein BWX79_03259 [Alphaproteobacteria bacterium ADurb.Bin100]|nr:MAG: hypothetical protein BWX79_03259 [Alphaproteobacteria bacterium ADurb.Bin100]
MGLTVMLPQSLNQMSFWICGDTVAAKPARCSSAASACTRGLSAPEGSPMISPLPKWWRITPRAFTAQLACTTQPMTWRAGIARAISPVGSTACSAVPASAPPKPSKNHQGTPFMAVSTTVSGPISGAMWRATSSSAGALTAMTTRSCTPSAAGSLLARTAWVVLPSASTSCRPFCCSAASVAPRATTLTEQPTPARRAPSQPPMAPAP